MIHRRSFITGLISLVAAPAIVRVGSLMPVKRIPSAWEVPEGAYWRSYAEIDELYGRGPMMDALPLLRLDTPFRAEFYEALAKTGFAPLPGHTLRPDLCHSSSTDEAIAAPRKRQVVLG